MKPILEFRDIARSFKRDTPVLTDVSFSMQPGEVVGLLGQNGTGKTTLIRIAMGMLFPHAGSVRVFGLSPTEDAVAVKRRVGYVAEDQVLPPGSTVRDMLAFHRHLFPTWDDAFAKLLLSRFGLSKIDAKIRTLSKGQARQVALICAVAHRPELLVLDEPAGGLDPAVRREFLETSIQLLNREGTAILFSSHHMNDVERLGGRVVLLDEGRVLLDCPLDELRERYCVAMIPRAAVTDAHTIERVPGCVRARAMVTDWHAVFRGTPGDVSRTLGESLHVGGIRCVTVPLEELFVALMGGDRSAEAAA